MKMRITSYLILSALAALVPVFISNKYLLHVAIIAVLYVIIAESLNLVVGYLGYISFAHNALYGIGAYASALLVVKLGFSFWVAVPSAIIITAFAGLLVGLLPLGLRLKGPYFALVTMAFGLVIMSVVHNWESLTGGPKGLPSIPSPESIMGISFNTRQTYYYLVLFFAVLSILFVWRLSKSKAGRAFLAIREDEGMAEAIGINVGYYKVLCFTISAGLMGLAGSLFAHYSRFLGPDMFALNEAVDQLTMVIIGGMGSIGGPIVGAISLVILPEVLRGLEDYRQVIFSLILILAIMFMPKGLTGTFNWVKNKALAKH